MLDVAATTEHDNATEPAAEGPGLENLSATELHRRHFTERLKCKPTSAARIYARRIDPKVYQGRSCVPARGEWTVWFKYRDGMDVDDELRHRAGRGSYSVLVHDYYRRGGRLHRGYVGEGTLIPIEDGPDPILNPISDDDDKDGNMPIHSNSSDELRRLEEKLDRLAHSFMQITKHSKRKSRLRVEHSRQQALEQRIAQLEQAHQEDQRKLAEKDRVHKEALDRLTREQAEEKRHGQLLSAVQQGTQTMTTTITDRVERAVVKTKDEMMAEIDERLENLTGGGGAADPYVAAFQTGKEIVETIVEGKSKGSKAEKDEGNDDDEERAQKLLEAKKMDKLLEQLKQERALRRRLEEELGKKPDPKGGGNGQGGDSGGQGGGNGQGGDSGGGNA